MALSKEINVVPVTAAGIHLPSEITRQILSWLDLKHLNRCKSVCKSWYNLIRTEFIIIDIFLRLPVQSLLRFKSISNYCCNLISDTDFIKLHHKYQVRLNPSVILIDQYQHHPMYSARLNPSINNDHHVRAHDYPRLLSFVGSCNGLLCFRRFPDRYVVHNPATRVFYMVPPDPSATPTHISVCRVRSAGFGYDCKSDDYKILTLTSKHNQGAFIYSLKGNSWMKIQKPPSGSSSRSMVFVNNAFHWIVEITSRRIMSFELASEQYGEVPMPRLGTRGGDIELSAPGGSHLHLLHEWERMDLWIWKDSHTKHGRTWNKLFSLTYQGFDRPLTYVSGGSRILLGSSEKPEPDEIVDFMSYEFKTNKLEEVRIFDGAPARFRARDPHQLPNESCPIEAVEWAESLFPLRRSDINEEERRI